MTMTSNDSQQFCDTIRQAMADWNKATQAQRDSALAKAAQLANS